MFRRPDASAPAIPRELRCREVSVDAPSVSLATERQRLCRFRDLISGRDYQIQLAGRRPIVGSLERLPREAAAPGLDESLVPETRERLAIPLAAMTIDPERLPPVGATRFEALRKPFRGYWWPWSGALYPTLAKYDEWVRARGLSRPSALEWERAYHRPLSTWSGHCNGWAASSLLYPEPIRGVVVRDGNVSFGVADIKGLLASLSFCVRYSFHGQRYRQAGDDPTDIDPKLFHRVLLDNLGNRRRGVAVDVNAGEGVDNQIVSGGVWTVSRLNGDRRFRVRAALDIHIYDGGLSDVPGVAPFSTRIYTYDVTTDVEGRVIEAAWVGENPDFLWVPLEPADCGRDNPHVKSTDLDELVEAAKNN